ncbi:MAG: pantetheine-phosphate adenylyltransferase [Planctomycetota bacterium]
MTDHSPIVHTACYAGSFDPPTYGHLDVISRARRMFDRVVLGVGTNPSKHTLFSGDERVDLLNELVAQMVKETPGHAPVHVERFTGLTVDFATETGATVLIRGIRNLNDLTGELQQAITNQHLAGIETVFVGAGSDFSYVSSTLIRQVTAMGNDLSILEPMCPRLVIEALAAKKSERPEAIREIIDRASG